MYQIIINIKPETNISINPFENPENLMEYLGSRLFSTEEEGAYIIWDYFGNKIGKIEVTLEE